MNPITWSGPEFLFFYLLFAAAVTLALVLARRTAESGTPPRLQDPYAIAYLRGGAGEALRVAVAALIGRGALTVADQQLTAQPVPERLRPLDEALLQHFSQPRGADSIFRDDGLRRLAEELRVDLERQGLLAGTAVRSARRGRFLLALVVLLTVAGAKIAWALSHGRSNVLFLVGLASLASGAAWLAAGRGRVTGRGAAALDSLQRLMAARREQATAHGSGIGLAEAALLAGVFGVAAFPLSAEPSHLFRRSLTSGSSSTTPASCGSSCASSADSGGGGDSGGGDGGGSGCGGCGGGGD